MLRRRASIGAVLGGIQRRAGKSYRMAFFFLSPCPVQQSHGKSRRHEFCKRQRDPYADNPGEWRQDGEEKTAEVKAPREGDGGRRFFVHDRLQVVGRKHIEAERGELCEPFAENETASAPQFRYVLRDVITVEE